MAQQRLPPFPDELLEPARKADAIRLLRWLELPSRLARGHLQRWGEVAGVELEPRDYRALTRGRTE